MVSRGFSVFTPRRQCISRTASLNSKPHIVLRNASMDTHRELYRMFSVPPGSNISQPACSKITEHDLLSYSNRPKHVAGFYGRSLPDHLVDFSSPEGKRLFGEALSDGHMENYFRLAGQYFAQSDVTFCGLAVLCMVLNSLSIDPARVWKSPWRWYSEDMMGCCTPLEIIRKKGIDFDQFKSLAACKGANVFAIRFDENLTIEKFREDINRVTSSTSEFLVVCYHRKHVGQTGTGHFAPVAGYHEASDKVLLLDVARFKYPPHWVPVPLLFGAMKDIDPDTEKSRGYFLMSQSMGLNSTEGL